MNLQPPVKAFARPDSPSPKIKKKILLVDDHPMIRRGLRYLIRQSKWLEVCGEADNAGAAVELIQLTHPDLAVIDLTLKDCNGIDLIKLIKAAAPGIRIIVLSMHDEKLYAERVLRAGAHGYVNKQQSSQTLLDAVYRVLDGNLYLSPAVTDGMLHHLSDGGAPMASPIERLSNREMTTFELIGNGKSTREIAQQLDVSIKTVDHYRQCIREKLQLANSTELARHAVEWSLSQPGTEFKYYPPGLGANRGHAQL